MQNIDQFTAFYCAKKRNLSVVFCFVRPFFKSLICQIQAQLENRKFITCAEIQTKIQAQTEKNPNSQLLIHICLQSCLGSVNFLERARVKSRRIKNEEGKGIEIGGKIIDESKIENETHNMENLENLSDKTEKSQVLQNTKNDQLKETGDSDTEVVKQDLIEEPITSTEIHSEVKQSSTNKALKNSQSQAKNLHRKIR